MDNTRILFYRNLLFRCLLVGIGVAIFLFAATILLRDTWMPLAMNVFKLEEGEVSEQVLGTLLNVRLILLFFFLTPALALHWMIKKEPAG